ncbi:GNAT family N-acetyltransferase [Aestuariibacter salexigens]|uniref:GNAT family N-acetyltransferase n=1 Tax=Aestuariibacter salexigens TaxID=226010 RepID=UPI00047BFDC1|nr:GNAT family N-acetyltransferase [Aestuariibacter salexigens]
MEIKIDDLSSRDVIELLKEHLSDMYATSPPESVHALDLRALKAPNITFFSAWEHREILGCVALKRLDSGHVELKSMRTARNFRNRGVAKSLLNHVISNAHDLGYSKMSLETGTQDFFGPARKLYEAFGFRYCDPFSDYKLNVNSCFMTRNLK